MNPEVLSLIKLAGVFAIIIGLLSMKKPLNLVMSIASIVVVVLYALPVGQVLPALKTGLIGSNTINAILVLYCITYLQRMMESRRQLAGCEEAMNGLFSHYLFFSRAGDLMGLSGINLWASCCGHKEARPYLTRTQDQEHWTLMDLRHKARLTCPWCGREVTAIDLSRAKGRKSLRQTELTVLLHAKGDALYADALVLYKDYADEAALTAGPVAWCSSGYRFVQGEVMQVDHQWDDKHPRITYERGKLGRKKLVQEPFKAGSISYSILNREALESHPFFRYCGFFDRWQYRPGGARGYAKRFHELISYLTAYSIYPRQIEMLSKAGYWQPIADLVWSRKKNAGAMCWEESDPRKAFGLDKRELAWFMEVHPRMEVLEVRNYVRRHWDKTWDLAFCVDFCSLWGGQMDPMDVLRLAKRYRTGCCGTLTGSLSKTRTITALCLSSTGITWTRPMPWAGAWSTARCSGRSSCIPPMTWRWQSWPTRRPGQRDPVVQYPSRSGG